MDFGYLSSGYSTIGSCFFEQYLDIETHIIDLVAAIAVGARAEYANALPECADPYAQYPTTFDLTKSPNIRRVLGDWIIYYQKAYPAATRTVLMPGLWAKDLTTSNWNADPYTYGFESSVTTLQRWQIIRVLIHAYTPIGIALRRRRT